MDKRTDRMKAGQKRKRGPLDLDLWQALIIGIASLACFFGWFIGTLSGEHFLFGVGIGAPVAIGLFNYLQYRNWSRKGSQVTRPKFWIQTVFLSVLGIFSGFLSSGGLALANAAVAKARIEDEVAVKELRASGRGSYRSVELFRARLESLRGHGTYLVNLKENDYNQFEMNSAFLIHYNIGLFGWKYAIGSLNIQPLNPHFDFPEVTGNIDSARQEETRRQAKEKIRILGDGR